MTRYRIFTKEVLVEEVTDLEEAMTIVQMYAEQGVKAEYEPYTIETKRLGRDPDLH